MRTWKRPMGSRMNGWPGIVLCCATVVTVPCHAADVEEIIRRGSATLQSDWAADPYYAYVERDQLQKHEKVTSTTSEVVYIEGSDYHLPLESNDQPFAPDREKA